MPNIEESIESKFSVLNELKETKKGIEDFIKTFDTYKSEQDDINNQINDLNKELKNYDMIDYLYSKLDCNLVSLNIVNKLIQQVKICKNEIIDDDYLLKCEVIYKYLVEEGYFFIRKILNKSVDLLYMNNDFVIFTNLMGNDTQIKQFILWQRSQECYKKKSYYNGDLNVFYRMMVKQECFVWSKLFYEDFLKTVNSLKNDKTFTLYEKFLYSILLPYFEEEEYISITVVKKEICIDDFYRSVEIQDLIYDLVLQKCYRMYTGYKHKVMEI